MDRQLSGTTTNGSSRKAHQATDGPDQNCDPVQCSRLRIRLSREGGIYAVILVVLLVSALVNEINLLVLLFGLMAGPFLFSGLLACNALLGIEVRRRSPGHVEAGEPFAVTIEAQHHKLLGGAWSITVEDQLQGPSTGGPAPQPFAPRVWFLNLPRGLATSGSYRGQITQRGLYRFGRMTVSTRFPLGLIKVSRTFDQPAEMVVYPRSGRLTRRWGRRMRLASSGQGNQPARAATGQNDYHGLRDFRPGDNPRSIHWRTSARLGRLMVREFEQNRREDFTLVLDLWAPPEPTEHQRDLVELAVSVTATICAEACAADRQRLVLVLGGETVRVMQGRGAPAMMHQVLRELAYVRPRAEGDLRHVLQQARAAQPKVLADLLEEFNDVRRGVLIVTTRPASPPWPPLGKGGMGEVRQPGDLDANNGANGLGARRLLDVGGPQLSELYQLR